MKKLSIIITALLLCIGAKATDIVSPNGKIKIAVEASKGNTYGDVLLSIDYNGTRILSNTPLGLETTARKFADNMRLESEGKAKRVKDNYKMITGKRSHCKNEATERTLTFANAKGQTLGITLRAYNDGVTFRYDLADISAGERITSERTAFNIPEGTKRWMQEFELGYERFFPLTTTGSDKNRNDVRHWGYPSLFEPAESVYMLLTESNIRKGTCATSLYNDKRSDLYQVTFTGDCVPLGSEWSSPWRVFIIGSLADVVESTLVTDVADPSKVKNTKWIEPGKAAWIYWAHNHGSRDYKILIDYVDLAEKMKWPYHLVDAEWDEMGNGGKIEDVVKYAESKGIKTMVWYNSSTAWISFGPLFRLNKKETRVKEFKWLQDSGISGIKVDFFAGDSTSVMDYCIGILEDAADHNILVNFHGATIPRGWQRTYPNLMTVEAVYGAEWYNNNGTLTNRAAAHNATLPFTRNVIGPMDYTPCTFTDSQHPHITTDGHELALPFLFESALQHMADRPSGYLSLPQAIRDLLTEMPTTWDDTRLLSGYPGTDVVLARRKGNAWYIAGINGTDEPRTLAFPLAPITSIDKKAGKSTVTLYKDNADGKDFIVENKGTLSSNGESITVNCLPRGGFVIRVK